MQNDTEAIRERLDRAGEQANLRDPSDLAKFVDVEGVKADSSGEIIGLDEAIADLRKTRPYLFKDHFELDASRPIKEQLNEFVRQLKPGEDELHKLVKGLDLDELSPQEFEDVLHFHGTRNPDGMAIRRLQAAAKRQTDARDVDRRGLSRAI